MNSILSIFIQSNAVPPIPMNSIFHKVCNNLLYQRLYRSMKIPIEESHMSNSIAI